jgi:hypothetical protein
MNYFLFLDDRRNPRDMYSAGHQPAWGNEDESKRDYASYVSRMLGEELELVHAKNFEQFKKAIEERGMPKYISFDHDLADFKKGEDGKVLKDDDGKAVEEYTGMTCAHWLKDYCLDNHVELPDFTVHSDNTNGRDNIWALLSRFRKHQVQNGL